MPRFKSKETFTFDAEAPRVRALIASGGIRVHTHKPNGKPYVVKLGDGRRVRLPRYEVTSTAAALDLLGGERPLLKAVSRFINDRVAAQTRAASVPLSKRFAPLAERISRLTGRDKDLVLKELLAKFSQRP